MMTDGIEQKLAVREKTLYLQLISTRLRRYKMVNGADHADGTTNGVPQEVADAIREDVRETILSARPGNSPLTKEECDEIYANFLAQPIGKPASPEDRFEQDVANELQRLRIRDAAKEKFAAEQRAANPAPGFDKGTLGEILARPPEPPYRVHGIIPSDASLLIVAMRKTGKTTLVLNLARCYLLGTDFLDRKVRPVTGRIAILNYEVTGPMLARWADEAGIPADRLVLVNLRGRRNPLNHPEDRAELAAWLRSMAVETLIVDPFGRAFTGESQNDAGQVTAFLTDLDAFARSEAGAADLVLTAHAGWSGDRTRGSTALEDWPDTIITMSRDKDEDSNDRYVKLTGRGDDEIEDQLLCFDQAARTLTLTGTTRKEARSGGLLPDLLEFLANSPGTSKTGIRRVLPGDNRSIDAAIDKAVREGLVRKEPRTGRGGGFAYWPANPAALLNPAEAALANPANPAYISGLANSSAEGEEQQQGCPRHPRTPQPGFCPDCKRGATQ